MFIISIKKWDKIIKLKNKYELIIVNKIWNIYKIHLYQNISIGIVIPKFRLWKINLNRTNQMCNGVRNFYSLTSIRPSVELSNIVGVSVPVPSSGHRVVRIHHYIIFKNNKCLFPIHLQLVRPPPLIQEPQSLLFSPEQYIQMSWSPLLHHCNVKIGCILI